MNRYKQLEQLDIEFQEAEDAWEQANSNSSLSHEDRQPFLDLLHKSFEKRRAHLTKHWIDPMQKYDSTRK
ncbi:MAG: hypothetical protein ACR2PX_00325 [Endozoicomonas sp.]|uniref:hypothetical protein n=1 Tax=Endozoicomonas sp. TaxID=1892382 RepID=UPI003D9BAEDE